MFRKGMIPWNKDRKIQTNTGRTHFEKGQMPWNKDIPCRDETKKKLSEYNKKNPTKGFLGKKHSRKVIEKIRKIHIGNKYNLGKKRSEESRKRMSESHIGKRPLKGTRIKMGESRKLYFLKHPELIEKIRKWQVNHPNRTFKNTSIELKIEEELNKRGISYQKQVPLCNIAIVDFYLPEYRIVIQCDGDYWHDRPKCKEKDERQDKVLTFNGFNVYRFWQYEINKSVENCINKLNIK